MQVLMDNLLGKATDPKFWETVAEKDCFNAYRIKLLDLWDKHCRGTSIKTLSYSDFKRYWVNGDRRIFEQKYFSRRLALVAASILALIYPKNKKYITKLMDIIYAICDEYTWCLPAHQRKLEVNNNSKIDLFAAETGFALAEIYKMLEGRLDELIKNRIKAELQRRIFKSYLSEKPYGPWENGTNNWTAVCTGSVACTFMLMKPRQAKKLIPRFEASMEKYLSGFTDDGVCLEGCSYWGYGFSYFTVYADIVKKFTKGEIDWFKLEKVKNISTFIQNTYIAGNKTVNFSDSAQNDRYPLGICHYLKELYPNDVLVYAPTYSFTIDGCGRYCSAIRSVTWLNEDIYNNPTPDNFSREFFSKNAEWLIKRTEDYGFAAKGGNNNEPHNHNDIGTFIFVKNEEQALAELGRGVYTRRYFSRDARYTILECSSRGHSVPIINGSFQKTGTDAKAKRTSFKKGVFTTDIAKAYDCPELKSLKRSFTLADKSVILTDEYTCDCDLDIIERIVTLNQPTIKGKQIKVGDAQITFDPKVAKPTINSEVRENGTTCYFIDFKLKKGERKFSCTMQ